MEEHLLSLLRGALSCPVQWGYFSDGETMPRVTIVRVGGRREHTLSSLGLMRAAVQIDCWAVEFDDAFTISRALRATLEGYRGGPVLSTRLTALRDGFSKDADAAQRVSLTFALTYRD